MTYWSSYNSCSTFSPSFLLRSVVIVSFSAMTESSVWDVSSCLGERYQLVNATLVSHEQQRCQRLSHYHANVHPGTYHNYANDMLVWKLLLHACISAVWGLMRWRLRLKYIPTESFCCVNLGCLFGKLMHYLQSPGLIPCNQRFV